MKDYLELYKKFNDIKDIKDLNDEVNELRYYYRTRQFDRMQEHIKRLMIKYSVETDVWNAVNCCNADYLSAVIYKRGEFFAGGRREVDY